ncbi:DUF2806 domain-containing protein [Vibrio jasicida]|uniref:DUF2806 domain-containing protein n=1 Tax=Vibrio jasicida TaxID=766224 RepID=UPI000CE423E3|nr:DUF2806 domain-containing protein [Vibrio jasicida]
MAIPGENLVIKMWDSLVDKGIGGALIPWQERRVGQNRLEMKAQEIIKLAEAEKLAEDIRKGKVQFEAPQNQFFLENRQGRIEPTFDIQALMTTAKSVESSDAIRKEVNISKAILVAEDILADDSSPSSEKEIEDDWLFNWREYAGRVSSEDLQLLWGKILAGEVKNPGSYSYRTLDFLKTMSKFDAEVLEKVAQFVVSNVVVREVDNLLEDAGVRFGDLIYLQELGVLSGVESTGLKNKWGSLLPDSYLYAFTSHDKCLIVTSEDATKEASLPVYLLTTVGKQIFKLANFGANITYLEAIGRKLCSQGFEVKIADWVQDTEDQGRFSNAVKIVA